MDMLSTNTQQTMTSLEISDLLQSRHDVVKKSIDRLVERNVIVQPPMVDEQFKQDLKEEAQKQGRTTNGLIAFILDQYMGNKK